MTGSTIDNLLGVWRCKHILTKGLPNESVYQLITEVFVEQPLASRGSAKYTILKVKTFAQNHIVVRNYAQVGIQGRVCSS